MVEHATLSVMGCGALGGVGSAGMRVLLAPHDWRLKPFE